VRPGVDVFADFVIAHQGGIKGRIIQRPCGLGQSGHNSGRAWDWAIQAEPGQREPADKLIAWLLKNDAELFRRAGITYIIWDKKIWTASQRKWKPYGGWGELGNCVTGMCRNAHTDHVHFSFSRAGSEGKTSFYDWLRGGQVATARPQAPAPAFWIIGATAFVVGFVGAEIYRVRRR